MENSLKLLSPLKASWLMPMNGILNVYKEKGMTSFDVVAILRRITKIRRIGHTGTLDPDATGVLPICIGKATKVVDLLTNKDKTYRATFQLGFQTDTQDISGNVIQSYKDVISISDRDVQQALLSFLGDYMQVPPMYSAIKKDGKRLYELARQGIEVEREARPVRILHIDNFLPMGNYSYRFDVTCSKGTYIRTLIHDLGELLGYGACMTDLERVKVGRFDLADAFTLSEIEKMMENNQIESNLHSIDSLFDEYPKLVVSSEYDAYIHNGNKLPTEFVHTYISIKGNELTLNKRYRLYDSNEHFVGLYVIDEQNDTPILRVEKMFY
jgi:tRNA pseudouridine55 synthase